MGPTWRSRHLLRQWIARDFTVQYRQTALGVAWAIAQPLLLLAVYGLVMHAVLDVTEVTGNYAVFALCGLAPWAFLSSAINRGVGSLTGAGHLVKQVYFPRAIVPLASTGVTTIDLIATSVLLVGAQVVLNGEAHLATLALVPIYLSLVLLMSGVAIVLAFVGALVRDIRFLVPTLLQLGFIATPVMYPSSLVPEEYERLYRLNPIGSVINAIRGAVIEGRWPSAALLGGLLLAGIATLAIALWYAASVEDRLPDLL